MDAHDFLSFQDQSHEASQKKTSLGPSRGHKHQIVVEIHARRDSVLCYGHDVDSGEMSKTENAELGVRTTVQ